MAGSTSYTRGRPRGLLYEQNLDADEEYEPYRAELWPSGIELARRHALRDRRRSW